MADINGITYQECMERRYDTLNRHNFLASDLLACATGNSTCSVADIRAPLGAYVIVHTTAFFCLLFVCALGLVAFFAAYQRFIGEVLSVAHTA